MGHLCGAETKKHTGCRRWLVHVEHCQHHRSDGAGAGVTVSSSAPSTSPRSTGSKVVRPGPAVWLGAGKVLGNTGEFAADLVANSSPLHAVELKAAGIVGDAVWDGLAKRWDPRSCRVLARAANRIDGLRRSAHRVLGRAVADVVVPRPSGAAKRFVHGFVEAMTMKVPLPFDAMLTQYALGLRLTGVALCAFRLVDVADCACLRDLFVSTAREITQRDLAADAHGWLVSVG